MNQENMSYFQVYEMKGNRNIIKRSDRVKYVDNVTGLTEYRYMVKVTNVLDSYIQIRLIIIT